MKSAVFFSDKKKLAFQFRAFHCIYFILSNNVMNVERIRTFRVTDIIFQITVPPNRLVPVSCRTKQPVLLTFCSHYLCIRLLFTHPPSLSCRHVFEESPHRGVRVLYCYVHRHKQDD